MRRNYDPGNWPLERERFTSDARYIVALTTDKHQNLDSALSMI